MYKQNQHRDSRRSMRILLTPLFALLFIFQLTAACAKDTDGIKQSAPHEKEDRKTSAYSPYWNDVALYLAGESISDGSELSALAKRAEYQKHRHFFESIWPRVVSDNLNPMTEWGKTHLADANGSGRNVFYPFSGPDVLNIYTFYPTAREYYMFGMEPPGLPPDPKLLLEQKMPAVLANIQVSLQSILQVSFFRTLSMAVDLKKGEMDGAAPIMMVFLARTGNRVLDVRHVALASDGRLYTVAESRKGAHTEGDLPGSLQEHDPLLQGSIPGIRIIFLNGRDQKVSSVTFFSLDIRDAGLAKTPHFLEFIASRGPFNTYLKAASYLMHRDEGFNKIREAILGDSQFIMQDDSGMPVKFFDPTKWDLTFFGNYTRPIPLFAVRYQPDLKKIYTTQKEIEPLPFGIGYNFQKGQSNLMIARKKAKQ